MIRMPGESWSGGLPALTESELELKKELEAHVTMLADQIGERNFINYDNLKASAEYIETALKEIGYTPKRQDYIPNPGILARFRGANRNEDRIFSNIIAEKEGSPLPGEILVIGAHYDSVAVPGCRGANDNASGIAATLALARILKNKPLKRTVRFIAFVNEEPPFFWTKSMGSYVYATECREKGENIVGMITPETIGYYSDQADSQRYPFPLKYFYPSKGNFIAFVGNISSIRFVRKVTAVFRETTQFPSEGAALPGFLPGVSWSDHWPFWKAGYSALMVTDTAPFRYPYYHTAADTTAKINFDKMTRVVAGLEKVVAELANLEGE